MPTKSNIYFLQRLKQNGIVEMIGQMARYSILSEDKKLIEDALSLQHDLLTGSGKGHNMRMHKRAKELAGKMPDFAPGMKMVLIGDGFGVVDLKIRDKEHLRSMMGRISDAIVAIRRDASTMSDSVALEMLRAVEIKINSGRLFSEYQRFSNLYEVWARMHRRAKLMMTLQDAAIMFSCGHRQLCLQACALLESVNGVAEELGIKLGGIIEHRYYGSDEWFKRLNKPGANDEELIKQELKDAERRSGECLKLLKKILEQ